jgi:hypothetical protein
VRSTGLFTVLAVILAMAAMTGIHAEDLPARLEPGMTLERARAVLHARHYAEVQLARSEEAPPGVATVFFNTAGKADEYVTIAYHADGQKIIGMTLLTLAHNRQNKAGDSEREVVSIAWSPDGERMIEFAQPKQP